MLGWLDMDSSVCTIVQWLRSFRCLARSKETLHMFVRTLVGGYCREHGTRSFHECPLLEWVSVLEQGVHPPAPPSQFFEDVQLATDNGVFFIITNGRMGLGPASTSRGTKLSLSPAVIRSLLFDRPFTRNQAKQGPTVRLILMLIWKDASIFKIWS